MTNETPDSTIHPDNPDNSDIGQDNEPDIPPATPPAKRVRTRLSLDLTPGAHADLVELAGWWHATLHQTINRAIAQARHFHALENPDDRWGHLPPEKRPAPGWWERHEPRPTAADPNHVDVVRLEILR